MEIADLLNSVGEYDCTQQFSDEDLVSSIVGRTGSDACSDGERDEFVILLSHTKEKLAALSTEKRIDDSVR